MKGDHLDPKALIREAYAIDGIVIEECRSIFLDWALSVPEGENPVVRIHGLLSQYGTDFPNHPMSAVLRQGLQTTIAPRRRGGRNGRQNL